MAGEGIGKSSEAEGGHERSCSGPPWIHFTAQSLLRSSPGRTSLYIRRTHAFDPWRLRANLPWFARPVT
jgi:hypothetical protein